MYAKSIMKRTITIMCFGICVGQVGAETIDPSSTERAVFSDLFSFSVLDTQDETTYSESPGRSNEIRRVARALGVFGIAAGLGYFMIDPAASTNRHFGLAVTGISYTLLFLSFQLVW